MHPDEFAAYEKAAYGKGFLMVSATPLTRSSYHAGDDFAIAAMKRKLAQSCAVNALLRRDGFPGPGGDPDHADASCRPTRGAGFA